MTTSSPSLTGTVVSNKCEKTITIAIERKVRHPVYGKYIKRSTKIHAHSEDDTIRIGDTVTVEACRPYSKTKSWKLKTIDRRAVD